MYDHTIDQDCEKLNSLCVLLCSIGDPHNLGAILRTAYFLGVQKVYTTNCNFIDDSGNSFLKSTCPLTPVVSKSSCGVLEIYRPVHIDDAKTFIEMRKGRGWEILGSDMGRNDKNIVNGLYLII